jgi:hypothetical protein
VTLACTPGAIVYGNIATCAAGVSAGATGTIALNDAYTSPQGGAVSTVLSTQTVAGGQTALFTLPPLPVAAIVSGVQSAHAITALYTSNNGNNNSAISSPAYVTVNPAAPTLTVACPGGAYSGTAYSCTGSATGIGGATVTGSFGFVYTGVSGTTYGPSTTAPTNGGTYSVVGTFTSTDSNYASGGTVSATLTIYSLTITPASLLLTFNPQKVGTSSVAQYIELFNHGTTSTVVSGATLTGAGFVMSNQAGTCTTGETLQPGTHCVIRIIFTPAGGGPATGTVVIGSVGAPGGSYTVTLTGTGEAPVTASVTATNKTYDDTYTEPVGNVTCALTAGGSNVTCAATAASFASANVGTGITVTATGITLSGSASAYYYLSSTSATTTANINPAAPTLSVSCPAVTFNAQAQNTCTGTATGVGGASVSGSFSFAPGNETNAGTYTETGTFTSTDPHNNYVSGGTASASFTINPATPALSVNCPAVSFNGQAQMPCTGTATGVGGASVSGSFSFAPGSETNAGTYTETGTFASTNSNYASGGTASGSFTIYPVLSITTASLPNGILGAAYSASLTASGGMGSYTWSIPSGQPGWLTLNGATGAITGTPSAAGSYTLTVQVRDSNTPADVATTSLTIVVGSGPAITGLSVTSGYVGLNITITGLRFGATQGTSTVTFNGVLATAIVSWSNTAIKAAIPAGAQNGNVVVKVAGQASNGVPFFLEPWITGISIGQGPIGMGVVISGYNFGAVQGTSTVTFNGLQAAVAAEAVSPTDPTAPPAPGWNDTQITAQVPEGATTGGIIVTTLFGASNSMQFTVDSPFGCGQ